MVRASVFWTQELAGIMWNMLAGTIAEVEEKESVGSHTLSCRFWLETYRRDCK
jgi:hypothetical protein